MNDMNEAVFDRVAGFYDYEIEDFVKDIPFYIEYAKMAGDEVLELACGTGRVYCKEIETQYKEGRIKLHEK